MKTDKFYIPAILTFLLLLMQFIYGCGAVIEKKGTGPASDMVCDKRADDALKNNNYEKSIILHEFFIKENPENGLAMYHMGFSYGQLGDHENELKFYEKAVTLGYNGSGVLFNLGMAYGEMGKFDDSIRILKKAIEVEPDRPDNHFGLALAYQRSGADKPAIKEFKKAIKLDPQDADAVYFLGMLYAETGRLKEAGAQLEKLIKIDPGYGNIPELKRILDSEK